MLIPPNKIVRYSEREGYEARPRIRGLFDGSFAAAVWGKVTGTATTASELHEKQNKKLRAYELTHTREMCFHSFKCKIP
jgi:hypothetical protein